MEQPKLSHLDHLVLTVADINISIAFYCNVLGMTHAPFTVADGLTRHALKFGRQKINLHQAGAEFEPKAKSPAPGSADLCFLTTAALAAWQVHFANTHTQQSRKGQLIAPVHPVPSGRSISATRMET